MIIKFIKHVVLIQDFQLSTKKIITYKSLLNSSNFINNKTFKGGQQDIFLKDFNVNK